jgi:hypothetical protein
MKTYPKLSIKKKEDSDTKLTTAEAITKTVAMVVVLISVCFFFFKILFF